MNIKTMYSNDLFKQPEYEVAILDYDPSNYEIAFVFCDDPDTRIIDTVTATELYDSDVDRHDPHNWTLFTTKTPQRRSITPHKGGRDKWLSARVTEDERDRIKAVLDKRGLSLTDWIMARVTEEEVTGDK